MGRNRGVDASNGPLLPELRGWRGKKKVGD